jgi:hypothetical protein
MLKKTIQYVDYDGNTRKEDFYFNLTKAEIAEMELSTQGGMTKKIEQITMTQNQEELITIFKDMIIKSYGVKSPDGKRFIKSQQLREEFMQTEAYSDLFIELASDAKVAADFINGVLPQIPNKPPTN